MTKEGRLMRGKENYEKKRFLNNSETLEYVETLSKEKPKETLSKEVKKEKK